MKKFAIYIAKRQVFMREKINMIWQKLLKIRANNYEIAAGVACGVAISFTPFVGFHLVLAVMSAWLIKANVAAAAIGTLFGNPWTFPFIWAGILYVGERISGVSQKYGNIDFEQLFKNMFATLKSLDIKGFESDVLPIFQPMLLGSIPFYLLSWIIAYIITERLLNRYGKQ